MVRVKICGNTNPEDAKLAAQFGAHYLGFIFAESKRKINIPKARVIMQAVPNFRNFVGVFSNQPKKEVETIAGELGLKILQFHGDETALYCHSFMEKSFQVIKSFRIKEAMSLKRLEEYNVTAFLFDAFSKEDGGGTGTSFDWNIIEDKPYVHEKLFLAGGLNVDNLRKAIQKIRPYAVDVASGVEKEPGKKDPVLLRRFIDIAKDRAAQNAQKSPLH